MEEKYDYNKITVYYCKKCLSLRIRGIDDMNYCDKCSSTDIETTTIDEWEKLYEEKYGHKFINE